MSKFTPQALPLLANSYMHSVCYECWRLDNPDQFSRGKDPIRMDGEQQQCCLCDRDHKSGIYVRMHPESSRLLCKKRH